MAEQDKSNKKLNLLLIALLVIFTTLIFSNSMNNSILYGWDDGEYLQDKSIQNFEISKFFSSFYLGMYQPLAVLTLSANYQQSKDNPKPYHSTNLLIHLINIVLVFYLFYRLTMRREIAFIVAFLFAIHPMHVEAVAWIATRSNGLYSLFFLASLLFYTLYQKRNSYKYLILAFVAFVLSCFSKSMAVTLPVVLLLFDYYHQKKFNYKLILEKIPFFIVSVVFGLISINAASEFGHIKNLQVDYNVFDRLVLIIYSIVFYIVRLIAPVNLSAVYAYPAKFEGFLAFEYYISILILAIIVFGIFKSGKFKKDVLFGSLFFLVTIGLVLPLVWSRMLMLADRYTYIPYLGLFFIVGRFYVLFIDSKHIRIRKYKTAVVSVLIVYGIFLSVSAYQRNKVWNNSLSMITDVIEKDRSDVDVSIGYFFRGNIQDIGLNFENALHDFSKAIELNPDYTMAYNNRGIIKGEMQDFEGALKDFDKAVELQPDYADGNYNRANALYYLGMINEACRAWNTASLLGSKQAEVNREKYCK